MARKKTKPPVTLEELYEMLNIPEEEVTAHAIYGPGHPKGEGGMLIYRLNGEGRLRKKRYFRKKAEPKKEVTPEPAGDESGPE